LAKARNLAGDDRGIAAGVRFGTGMHPDSRGMGMIPASTARLLR
jgi:hypothetical protein